MDNKMCNILRTLADNNLFYEKDKEYRIKILKLFKPYLKLFETYDGEEYSFQYAFKDNEATVEISIELSYLTNDVEVLIWVNQIECDEYSYVLKAFELYADRLQDKAYSAKNENEELYNRLKEILG